MQLMRVGQLTTAGGRRTRATVAMAPAGADPPTRGSRRTAATRATPLAGPLVLERYRLHRRLGAGGFGTVWMAHDERLDRDVAVKILPRERVVGGRFEREARAAARLSHPAIVTLYEAATDDEGAYLVSELVRGSTLERALTAGRLSDRAILRIGVELCDALAHAHAHAVVHRDVKPSNILLPARAPAPSPTAKLTDFGVARVLGGNTLTRTGELIGTAAYMAPEQAEGREATEAADLYSLALVIYEALTGVNPVPVPPPGRPARRLALHLPPLRRQRRELPRDLGRAIDLALRPRARERGTLAELQAVLEAAGELVSDTPGVVAPPRLAREGSPRGGGASAFETAAPTGAPPAEAMRPAAPAGEAADPIAPPAGERLAAPAGEPTSVQAAPTRALAAAVTACLCAWIAAHLVRSSAVPVPAAALVGALAVLVAPRLGWLALTAATGALMAAQGRTGAALLMGAGALLPVFAAPRDGTAWPLAAVAPALAVIGLGGAWPGLAGSTRGLWRRAGLGALGWVWIWLASVFLGRDLYLHRPAGTALPRAWASSVDAAIHHVASPLFSSGLLAGALAWGAAAAVLPLVRSRRSLSRDATAVAIWALGLCAATALALSLAGATALAPRAGTMIVGALVAGAVVMAPRALAARADGARYRAPRLDLRSMGQP